MKRVFLAMAIVVSLMSVQDARAQAEPPVFVSTGPTGKILSSKLGFEPIYSKWSHFNCKIPRGGG